MQSETITEPLSLEDIKEWLIVSHSEDDALIMRLYKAVKLLCEARTKQFFTKHTVTVIACIYEPVFYLPRLPLLQFTSVTKRKYNLEEYEVLDADKYVLSASMDTLYFYDYGTFKIIYEAGYDDENLIPDVIKQAMLSELAHLYENRGDKDMKPGLCATTVQMLTPYINTRYAI